MKKKSYRDPDKESKLKGILEEKKKKTYGGQIYLEVVTESQYDTISFTNINIEINNLERVRIRISYHKQS